MFDTSAPLVLAGGASAAVALLAWHFRALSASGALAAAVVGTVALHARYGFGIYLITWFALAALLSRMGKARKAALVGGVVDKGSQRDSTQVLANGGVFCALVLWSTVDQCDPGSGCARMVDVAAAAALAAAGADTWATEVGTLVGGAPWSIRSATRVVAGTSGAVTLFGTLALVAGALTLAGFAALLGVVRADVPTVLAVAAGGTAGAVADTLIGAWLQERRWCEPCTTETEQLIHDCGTATVYHHGLRGVNNDVVNLLCTVIGAATGALLVLG